MVILETIAALLMLTALWCVFGLITAFFIQELNFNVWTKRILIILGPVGLLFLAIIASICAFIIAIKETE